MMGLFDWLCDSREPSEREIKRRRDEIRTAVERAYVTELKGQCRGVIVDISLRPTEEAISDIVDHLIACPGFRWQPDVTFTFKLNTSPIYNK
jgi:hypothetical protein